MISATQAGLVVGALTAVIVLIAWDLFSVPRKGHDDELDIRLAATDYWQDRLAKFFPKSKGPTGTEVDMFQAGVSWARGKRKNKRWPKD